jgi:LPS-assembly protein
MKGEDMSRLARVWIACVCVWLVGQTGLFSAGAGPRTPPPPAEPTVVPAPCASAPGAEPNRVIIQAETLEYFEQEKRAVATGNVTVTYGDRRLLADQLELHTDTNTGTAQGHVRLLTPEDDLAASRIDFDLNTERGVLYDSAGKVARTYQVAGERIERLGPRTLEVRRGRITTCTSAVPEWEFRTPEAHIGVGDYVTLKQPSFWIKGIPVFYVPYFVFPIKDKRTTGFLPPHVGSSRQFGQIIGGEFFWAMTDWMDSTFGVEYLTKAGVKPEVEWRYALDPESDGQLNSAFVHDKTTGQDLWRVLLQQRQDFGWGIRGVSQIDVRSEGDIVRRFARTIDEESAIRTASYGALTKLYYYGGVTLEGASYDGIPASGTSEQFRFLPSLRFSQFPTALPGGLWLALESSYARLSTTNVLDNTPVQRLDFFPHLLWPVAVPPWGGLTVTAGVHETLYDHDATGTGMVTRHVPDLLAVLEGPTLRRRYNGIVAGQRLIHMITARLAYRYVPVVRQDDVPAFVTLDEERHFLDPLENFTLIDRIRAANYAKFSFIQRVYAQGLESTGSRSVREVARLILSQGLDIRQATEHDGRLVGPLDIDLGLRLWSRWWLDSILRVAPATGDLQEVLWRAGIDLWPGWALTVTNFQRQDPDIQYVLGGVQMTPLPGVQLTYHMRYDARTEEFREHLLTVRYQAVCYRVDMRFRVREAGDTDFFIQVHLWNL